MAATTQSVPTVLATGQNGVPATVANSASSVTPNNNAGNVNRPPYKDTTLTKLFVGGLPYHTTDETLRKHFEQYGDIEEAVVITDRQTSKSKGYGFVTMSDPAAAARACQDPNPIIDGRKANVNLAFLGAKPRTIQSSGLGTLMKQFTLKEVILYYMLFQQLHYRSHSEQPVFLLYSQLGKLGK